MLSLPAPQDIHSKASVLTWPWETQTGTRWCALLAPWEKTLAQGLLIQPTMTGKWPSTIQVNNPGKLTRVGTFIISIWQVHTLPLTASILGQR